MMKTDRRTYLQHKKKRKVIAYYILIWMLEIFEIFTETPGKIGIEKFLRNFVMI